jgi:hypothetical protein
VRCSYQDPGGRPIMDVKFLSPESGVEGELQDLIHLVPMVANACQEETLLI